MALCKSLWRATALCAAAFASTQLWVLDNYRATYDLTIRGINAGKVTHEAIFTSHTYRIDTVANPSSAAKLLGYGTIRESVSGLLQGDVVLPERYQRSMDGDAEFALNYTFSADKKEVAAQIGGKAQTFPYPAGEQPLDILSMVVQSLIDVEQGITRGSYALISEDTLRSYRVEALPDEKGANGENVKVFRQVYDNRETRIYLAGEPLRLQSLTQARGGKVRFALKLVDYQKR